MFLYWLNFILFFTALKIKSAEAFLPVNMVRRSSVASMEKLRFATDTDQVQGHSWAVLRRFAWPALRERDHWWRISWPRMQRRTDDNQSRMSIEDSWRVRECAKLRADGAAQVQNRADRKRRDEWAQKTEHGEEIQRLKWLSVREPVTDSSCICLTYS